MIRVGFIMPATDGGWLGGVSYYRNLISALCAHEQARIQPVILTSAAGLDRCRSSFPDVTVLEMSAISQAVPRIRRGVQRVLGRDFVLERELRRCKIDVLSHSGYLGMSSSIPSIVWIPDFQERSFSSFFSARERNRRERNLRNACRHATTIILSSHHALDDLTALTEARSGLAEVLQFVADVPVDEALPSASELRGKYALPDRYFHLPNQFWMHKNHEVVIRALKNLRDEGRFAFVISTGDTHDPRRPEHFRSMMDLAGSLGVADMFRSLGRVPYADLMGLMRHAVAVVNPSQFEGWSTTVEEAKSMGKVVLLSDIPVHREQMPDRAIFFDPLDARAAAAALVSAADRWNEADNATAVKRAAITLPFRRHAFADRYRQIVENTIGHHRRLQGAAGSRILKDF